MRLIPEVPASKGVSVVGTANFSAVRGRSWRSPAIRMVETISAALPMPVWQQSAAAVITTTLTRRCPHAFLQLPYAAGPYGSH